MSENTFVTALLNHGYGGGDAVVVPGGTSNIALPVSDSPAGVDFALNKLINSIKSQRDGVSNWLFLIGGPGNGKSFQVQKLIDEFKLGPLEDEAGLALRKRNYSLESSNLLLVNDATIRPRREDGCPSGHLAREIREIRQQTKDIDSHAFICINRGILVEERAQLNAEEGWNFERELFEILIHQQEPLKKENTFNREVNSAYYQYWTAPKTSRQGRIDLHLVFLDQISLLESQPAITTDNESQPPSYSVQLPDKASRQETPFATLINGVIRESHFEAGACGTCEHRNLCPYLANVNNLRDEHILGGVLQIIRSAEILSGQLFTYRDAWSVIVTLIIGNRESDFEHLSPCKWIHNQLNATQSDPKILRKLSRHRYFEAMFQAVGLNQKEAGNSEDVGVAVRRLWLADPARDATREWASVIYDALQAMSFKQLPLSFLSDENKEVTNSICKLDKHAEKASLSPLFDPEAEISDSERRELLNWRGVVLFRFYGVKIGRSAHFEIVREILNLRASVRDNAARLPTRKRLPVAVKKLVLPVAQFSGIETESLLPVFEPRVIPVTGPRDSRTWCYEVPINQGVNWTIHSRGDNLWISLHSDNEQFSEFHLDFALAREAMACNVLHRSAQIESDYGFTEQGCSVSPRIERIRASFLGGMAGNDLGSQVVLSGPSLIPILTQNNL